jgi:hypothetical protein
MNGSQGRAGRAGRLGLGTALVASGVFAAWGPSPALADPIRQDPHPARVDATTDPSSAPPKPAPPPSGAFEQALKDYVRDGHEAASVRPSTLLPAMSPANSPAAESLPPDSLSVANHGTGQPCGCPPPPPCSAKPPAATTSPSQPPVTHPTSSALADAAAFVTPTPEPSTILSALAMMGAVALGRRATRPRG